MAQLDFTLDDKTLKELMLGDRDEAVRVLLEKVFNAVLQAEVTDQIGAGMYERSDERETYRNGYRIRQFTTRVGSLTLHIPKLRNGTFSTELFQRYQRSEQALQLTMMEMYIQGVSTRKVQKITEELCGTSFSKSTVSLLCKQLDTHVTAFRERSLDGRYPFLIVDAIYTKVRERSAVRSKGVLIAIGIREDGYRELLGYEIGDSESYATWSDLFQQLKSRGLSGVDFVVSDQHRGLVQAVKEQFQDAIWQRCQVHFMRNLLGMTPSDLKSTLSAQVRDMLDSPDLDTARRRKDDILTQYAARLPRVMDLLDDAFDDVSAVFSLPERYRKRLRTSNMIERLNGELRRRENVIRIFPNESSLIRLMGALLAEHHESWSSGRAYFNMSTYWQERDELSVPDDLSKMEGVA